jgi:uncharacterized protein YndB with AHSA1/START domain
MEPLIIQNTITINAPSSKVWDALINPQQTKKYMFGCEAISDWKVGSDLIWQMDYDGKPFIPVKGKIILMAPGMILGYTVFDPHSNMPDIPENYLSVNYNLIEQNGETILTVMQGDYNTVADGARRYKEAYNEGKGWDPILQEIKKLVEQS